MDEVDALRQSRAWTTEELRQGGFVKGMEKQKHTQGRVTSRRRGLQASTVGRQLEEGLALTDGA